MKAAAYNPEVIVLTLLSLTLTLLPVIAPVEGLLLTTLMPFPLLVLAVKHPWRYVLSVAGLEVGGLALVEGWEALLFFSQYGLAPLVMAWAVRHRFTMAQALVAGVSLPLLLGATLFIGASLLEGESPWTRLHVYVEQLLEVFQGQAADVPRSIEAERLAASAESLSRLILTLFPALLVVNHLMTNVLTYILARFYCARSRPPSVMDPPDLACWRASDYTVWVFLASGVALLLPMAGLSTLGLNVFLVTLAVYLLQGVAIALYWGRRVPLSAGLRGLLALLLVMVAGPLCVMGCIAVGLFDLWVDFRRLRRPMTS